MTSTIERLDPTASRLEQHSHFNPHEAKGRLSIIFTALIAAILLPEELSFYIGDLRLTIARALLIVISPYVIFRLSSTAADPHFKISLSDIVVPLAGVWMMVAVAVMQGAEKAIASAGILVLEFTMTYFAARTFVRQDADIVAALRVVCICISIVGLLSPLDSIFGNFVVHDWFGRLTGYHRIAQMDHRMGLLRASGTLEHPILLGTVCTVALLLSSSLPNRLRWPVCICCMIGLLLSFSSAPLSGLVLGLGLLAYRRVFRNIDGRWTILSAFVLTIIVLIIIFTRDPLGFILSHLTFDPESAYFRLLIWHYGTDALMTSPVFGVGLDTNWAREDWMPKSVDAFLLATAMNFGIPGSMLIVFSWLSPVLCPSTRPYGDADKSIRYGDLRSTMNIVFVVIFFISMTVHFWGITWMLFSLLAGLRASLGAPANLVPSIEPEAVDPDTTRRSLLR